MPIYFVRTGYSGNIIIREIPDYKETKKSYIYNENEYTTATRRLSKIHLNTVRNGAIIDRHEIFSFDKQFAIDTVTEFTINKLEKKVEQVTAVIEKLKRKEIINK